MNPKKLLRPEYVFQPRMVLKRFWRAVYRPKEQEVVRLPWGLPLEVRPSEVVGSVIWCFGVIDLVVAEAITRLLEPGELALDVGANIGQMTSLMAVASGKAGRVVAFEAHPGIAEELRANVARWKATPGLAPIEIVQCAVSEAAGEVTLSLGDGWEGNRGIAKVVAGAEKAEGGGFPVKAVSLDDHFAPGTKIGFCKLDVEGHEEAVLRGAKRLIADRAIRDIAFEELNIRDSALLRIFRELGYTVFSLHSRVFRPLMIPAEPGVQFHIRDGCNFLATLEPERAIQRFQAGGWRALRRLV